MSTTADIKNGAVINFKNARMKIVEFQHVKPGKGPAFVRTKLKDIQTGKIIDHTFNSGAKLEFIRVTSRKFQYLYKDGDSFVFMDNNTYDQINVDKVLMDDGHFYIKEGDNIEISFDDEEIISLLLPSKTILKVVQTDPGPMPTLTISAPRNINSSVRSAVTTLPAIIVMCGYFSLNLAT